jgi:uncharacterized protein with von Willebrand factor type A (vWA) domain
MSRRAQKIAALSPRARKLWDRLCAGEIYQAHSDRTPQAMSELQAAQLVTVIARPIEIWARFAPVGSKSYRPEVIAK